jgi:hypothetical protein
VGTSSRLRKAYVAVQGVQGVQAAAAVRRTDFSSKADDEENEIALSGVLSMPIFSSLNSLNAFPHAYGAPLS